MATIARNITSVGRRQRTILGIVAAAAGVLGAVLLVLTGLDRGIRVALFLPFFGAGLGLFQARDRTCVFLASRGQCEIDQGTSSVGDSWLDAQLRRQAREVLIESALL